MVFVKKRRVREWLNCVKSWVASAINALLSLTSKVGVNLEDRCLFIHIWLVFFMYISGYFLKRPVKSENCRLAQHKMAMTHYSYNTAC